MKVISEVDEIYNRESTFDVGWLIEYAAEKIKK
jgi:hypothetical protein